MAKQINIGYGGAVKKVKEVPFSIGGAIKKAKKGFCGVGGAVKEFFTSNPLVFSYKLFIGWYDNTDTYIQFNNGTTTSGSGTRVEIRNIYGHVIKIKIGASTSNPSVALFYADDGSNSRDTKEYSGTGENTLTFDCTSTNTNVTSTCYLTIAVTASKGTNYYFRIYDIQVDGESVMESFRNWVTTGIQ